MPDKSTWRKTWPPAVALVLLVFAIYARTASFGFIAFDDNEMLGNNPHLKDAFSPASLVWAFTTFQSGNWYPVTWLSHMLDWQLFGDWAGGHHLVNVIFHAANAVLLYMVLMGMTGSRQRSWAVAAIFAVHPIAVESVAWISERKNVLSTLLWLVTMWVYLAYVKRGGAWRYICVLLVFTFGLMSKPMLVTLPCALLLLDAWPLRRGQSWQSLVIEKLPLLAIALIFSALTLVSQHSQGALLDTHNVTMATRCTTTLVGYMLYLKSMVWPVGLAPLYPHPALMTNAHGWPLWQVLAAVALLITLTTLCIRIGRRREKRYLLVGWLWFLGVLFPVSGIIQVGGHSHADRYTYVPLIGLYIALVWACADWVSGSRQRQRAAQIAMAACLIMLSIMSFIQVGYWRNTLTLFTHTIEVTKDNGGAHFLVAVEWLELKREDEAEKHLSMAISIAPLKGKPHNALGVIRRRQGHYDQAVELWNASIKINSSASGPYINLGDNQYRQGNAAKAIELYLVAMMRISEEMPIHEVSRVADLTAWLLATRELPQYPRELALKIAISNYKRGKPDDPGKATTLAAAFAHAGQFKNAIAAIDHALKLAAKQNDPRQFARLTYYRQQFIERKPLRFRLASKAGP